MKVDGVYFKCDGNLVIYFGKKIKYVDPLWENLADKSESEVSDFGVKRKVNNSIVNVDKMEDIKNNNGDDNDKETMRSLIRDLENELKKSREETNKLKKVLTNITNILTSSNLTI